MGLFIPFLICWSISVLLGAACTADSDLWHHGLCAENASGLASRTNGPPLRNVYAVSDIALQPVIISPKSGKELLYGHAFLHVEGTAQDGALRIEHVQPVPFSIGLRVLDYTVANNDKTTISAKATRNTLRKIYLVGQTKLRNADFADPSTGRGLVLKIWSKNPKWVAGSNCCNQFVQDLVEGLNLETPKDFNTYVADAAEFAELEDLPFSRVNLPLYLDKVKGWGGKSKNEQIEFDTTDIQNPKLIHPGIDVDESGYLADTAVPSKQILDNPLPRPWVARPAPPSPFKDVSLIEQSSSVAVTGGNEVNLQNDGSRSSGSLLGSYSPGSSYSSINANNDLAKAVTTVRVNGVVSDLVVVLEATARAVGIAGMAIAPVFIILDFSHGNPVGGAFGAVGLFLGLLATSAMEGPVGWLVGGLSVFFAILPTFFKRPVSEPPQADNATEIIQYAMFGDIHHTGNEKCREQNPNCTAMYGPSVIGMSFKWNNFDPIAFLLHYNAGYAMTITEMASAFYIVDSSKPSDGADKIATITCRPPPRVCNRFNCPSINTKLCGSATFAINRSLITIPVLNETADKIYNRIIPRPHGDCKLVNDVSGRRYSDYNVTVTGSPAAIACGVTASLNISGTVSLINDTNANNGLPAAFHSAANKSTDGGIHEVAAPSPIGFPPHALNSSNAICLGGSGGNMCFPNGTYDIQTGIFGFDSGKVDNLSMAPGASLAFIVPAQGKPYQAASLKPWTYTTNQSASNENFANNFNAIVATALGPRTFNALMPSGNDGPPVVCLFSQPQYHGDVICYGVGSGNVSSNVVNVPQSLALHGNASAWLYGEYYGDDGGQRVSSNTPDLTSVPLGVDDNFSRKIKALWVLAG